MFKSVSDGRVVEFESAASSSSLMCRVLVVEYAQIYSIYGNALSDFLASWWVASSAASSKFDKEWRVKRLAMQIMTNN